MSRLRRILRSNAFYLVILAALILLPHVIGWITSDSPFGIGGRPRGQSIFWQGVMIEVFILAVLAMSYNLIFGFTGVISFGHALFFGISGYTLGIFLEKTNLELGIAFGAGIIVGILLAGLLGFIMGLVSLRLKGVYFALFTLAVAEMFFIYAQRWSFTSAEDGFPVGNIPDWLNPTRERLTFYYVALILLAFTFVFIKRLIESPTGSVLLAIRENEERAKTIGYHTLRFKLFSISMSAMLAASAGILHMLFNKKVGPEMFSLAFTIDPLLMTIIGGLGTLSGPVVGSGVLLLIERPLRDFSIMLETPLFTGEIDVGQAWSLILGIIFIVVVLLFPQGIVGTWNKWWAKLRQIKKP